MFEESRESICFEVSGKKIFGILHTPISKNCDEAIILIHGFGGNKVGANRLFVGLAKALTQSGVSVIRFDMRHCGDSEGDFCDITVKSQVEDLENVIEIYSKKFKKLALIGVSFGASIALMVLRKFSKIQAIAIIAPLGSSDPWKEGWEYAKKYLSDQPFLEHRGRLVSREFFEDFFEIDFHALVMEANHVPMLHIHGDKDCIVPVTHSLLFENWRKKSSMPTEFLKLPNTDHNFSNFIEQQILISKTVKWFQERFING
jgi:pimeloyl-ACP methyl ester carboxylesterase